MSLNLNNDNRFSAHAPTVAKVYPNQGPVIGGQQIEIHGSNFGLDFTTLREVVVRGVLCKDLQLRSDNLITCVTRSSTIMGAGFGNIVIKKSSGLNSPERTCANYEYANKCKVVVPIKQLIVAHPQVLTVQKFFKHPFDTNFHTLKADENNLISDNFKGVYNRVVGRRFTPNDDGFGKNRLKKILGNLEPCNKEK